MAHRTCELSTFHHFPFPFTMMIHSYNYTLEITGRDFRVDGDTNWLFSDTIFTPSVYYDLLLVACANGMIIAQLGVVLLELYH